MTPRIGTAGWSIPRTAADRFPGEGSHLERYARSLSCAEINSTFYRPARPGTMLRWAASTPEGFRFSVKAPRAITHDAALAVTREELTSFLTQARNLGEKLGPLLFQLPPKQTFDEARASDFLSLLRDLHNGPTAFEPRHASWFGCEADQIFRTFRIARVAADPPRKSTSPEPGGSTGLVYFRLHGSPRIYYSSYAADYLAKLAADFAAARGEVWCIFDNTASGAAATNALDLAKLCPSVNTKTKKRTPRPRP